MINTIILMLRRPGIVQNIKTISGCDAAHFVDNGAGDPSAALEIRQSRPFFGSANSMLTPIAPNTRKAAVGASSAGIDSPYGRGVIACRLGMRMI